MTDHFRSPFHFSRLTPFFFGEFPKIQCPPRQITRVEVLYDDDYEGGFVWSGNFLGWNTTHKMYRQGSILESQDNGM